MSLLSIDKIRIVFFLALIPTISLAEQTATFIVAGQDKNIGSPFMTVSTDQGKTWNEKSLPYSGNKNKIEKVVCTGADSKLCIAVGSGYEKDLSPTTPVISVSHDGGSTWQTPIVTGLPKSYLNYASCTGSGASALCVAVGHESFTQKNRIFKPLIVVSQDGGMTWTTKKIEGVIPSNMSLGPISCTGTGSSSLCALTGNSYEPTKSDMIVVSTDQGTSWHIKYNKEQITDSSSLYSISCTGEKPSAVCVAPGEKEDGSLFFVVSSDGGNTWKEKTTQEKIEDGFFLAIDCKGSGESSFCVAGGAQQKRIFGNSLALLVISQDGGKTWEQRSIKGLPEQDPNWIHNKVRDVSCTENGICVAAGYADDKNYHPIPLIAVSSDKGNTWEFKQSKSNVDEVLSNVSCAQKASTVCISTGSTASNSEYELWSQISIDGGNTWKRNDSIRFPTEGAMPGLFAH